MEEEYSCILITIVTIAVIEYVTSKVICVLYVGIRIVHE